MVDYFKVKFCWFKWKIIKISCYFIFFLINIFLFMFIFFLWKVLIMWKIGYFLNCCWLNVVYNSVLGRKEGIFLFCCICLNMLEENSIDVIWDLKFRCGILDMVCNLLRVLWFLWFGWFIMGVKFFLSMIVSFFNEDSIF